jgi:hypothetical protein
MIYCDEIQKGPGPMQFSMTVVEALPVGIGSHADGSEAAQPVRPGELSLTGNQVLAGCAAAFSLVGALLWAVIRLWLFEP